MEPTWRSNSTTHTRTNARHVIVNAFFMLIIPTLAVLSLLEEHLSTGLLWMGTILFFLAYETTVRTYTRVRFQDDALEFIRPLLRYSLLSRKKNLRLILHSNEWTIVYCYEIKRTRTYYFRKKREAVCFVSISGMRRFEKDLRKFFPERVSPGFNTDFPLEAKRRLSRERRNGCFRGST